MTRKNLNINQHI